MIEPLFPSTGFVVVVPAAIHKGMQRTHNRELLTIRRPNDQDTGLITVRVGPALRRHGIGKLFRRGDITS